MSQEVSEGKTGGELKDVMRGERQPRREVQVNAWPSVFVRGRGGGRGGLRNGAR